MVRNLVGGFVAFILLDHSLDEWIRSVDAKRVTET